MGFWQVPRIGRMLVAILAGVYSEEVEKLYGYGAIGKFYWQGDRRVEQC